MIPGQGQEDFADLEGRLHSLAEPLGRPEPGDWRAEHHEKGQTFRQYLSASPIRRDRELRTIYLCLLGQLDEAQEQVLGKARDFLALFYDVPVLVRNRLSLSEVPAWARRKHPQWGDKQLL